MLNKNNLHKLKCDIVKRSCSSVLLYHKYLCDKMSKCCVLLTMLGVLLKNIVKSYDRLNRGSEVFSESLNLSNIFFLNCTPYGDTEILFSTCMMIQIMTCPGWAVLANKPGQFLPKHLNTV